MRFNLYRDESKREEVLVLRLSTEDIQGLNLDRFDTALLEECGLSNKVSDKLLAAEMLVRRLEQQAPTHPTSEREK